MNFFWNLDPANQVLLILAVIALAFDRIAAICDSTARRRKEGQGDASASAAKPGASDPSSQDGRLIHGDVTTSGFGPKAGTAKLKWGSCS